MEKYFKYLYGNGLLLLFFVGIASLSMYFFGVPSAEAATVNVTAHITSNTTWVNSNVYVVSNDIRVDSGVTLTIQEGTVVKFETNRWLNVSGTLVADGTSTDKIYFTSYKDDSVGGDTNGDGSSTSPAAGNWGCVLAGDVTMDYAVVRYGGSGCGYANIGVDGQGAGGQLTLTNSEVYSSVKYGIRQASGTNGVSNIYNSYIHDNAEHGVFIEVGDAYLTSNTIEDNSEYGVYASTPNGDIDLTGNAFANNSLGQVVISGGAVFTHAGNTATGSLNGFIMSGVTGVKTWGESSDLPYIVNTYLAIPYGSTLNIEAGAVIKFVNYSSGIDIRGTLNADGTSVDKIYFTSYKDDSVGGDTNGDGSATSPAGGNWGDIFVNSTVSGPGEAIIDNAVIKYAGGWSYAAIFVSGNTPGNELTVSNSEISNSYKYGIKQASGTYGNTTVTDSIIRNNGETGVYMQTGTMTLTGNGIYDNTDYGVYNTTTTVLDAEGNWWGDASGPYNFYFYTSGSGDNVNNLMVGSPIPTPYKNVDADNWLTSW